MAEMNPAPHKSRLGIALAAALAAGLILTTGVIAQDRTNNPPPLTPADEANLDDPPMWVKPAVHAPNVERHTFESALAGQSVSYVLYLPPNYQRGQDRYPVVYWLHGRIGPRGATMLGQNGIPDFTADVTDAISRGAAPPMIIVFVNGLRASGYRDQPGRPVEQIIMTELIPHIDATYRTIPTREGRMVEGFSMGGAGAVKLGFKYPEVFGSISDFAGALHGSGSPSAVSQRLALTPEDDPWALAEANIDRVRMRTPIRIVVGAEDGLVRSNTGFHTFLESRGVEHGFDVVPGVRHEPWPLYDYLGDRGWAFYWEAFRMTPPARFS